MKSLITEKVSWLSDELKIVGQLFRPAAERPPFPCLVLCHGIPSGTKTPDDPGYPLLAERFRLQGFLVLFFNFRGTGESEGNFDLLGWARDLEGALDFLANRQEADSQRIYLMGFSGGAAVSIYVAAHRQEVAGLVSCASPADFGVLTTAQGLKEFWARARIAGIIRNPHFPSSFEDWKKSFHAVKPETWVERIPPRPLLILHGTQDEVVRIDHARRLHEKVKGKAKFHLIEGGGHRLRVEPQAMDEAMAFLRKIAFRSSSLSFAGKER
jgi:pimeloyl-ACP methyl ester carboxylesterase